MLSSLRRKLSWTKSAEPAYITLRPTVNGEEELGQVPGLDDVPLIQEKDMQKHSRRTVYRILAYLTVLLPSFLQFKNSTQKRRLHPTAWLDGLRGVAATFVVIHHSSLLWFSWSIHDAWRPGKTNWFIQLPFIRLVIAGPPQVMIFFVISGYALSYKPLKLARQGRFAELNNALASSVFRRHSRLFLPAIVVTFSTAVLTWLGAFGTKGWSDVAIPSRQPSKFDNLWEQLGHWAQTMTGAMDPLGKDMYRGSTEYDENLWTLPIEFDSSMVIFLALAALSRLSGKARLSLTFTMAFYAEYFTIWPVFLFLAGMFMCDLHMLIEERAAASVAVEDGLLPSWTEARRNRISRLMTRVWKFSMARKAVGLFSFLGSVYLLSMPEVKRGAGDSPGYKMLTSLIPGQFAGRPDYFWLPIAAVWLVLTIDQTDFLQILFTNAFAQYLGRISFALYLVHGPLLWTLGFVLGKTCLEVVGNSSNEAYILAMAFAAALWWPVAIWVADLTQRFVDAKCVQASRWVYDGLTKRE